VCDPQERGTTASVRGTKGLVDSESRNLESGYARVVSRAQGQALALLGFEHERVGQQGHVGDELIFEEGKIGAGDSLSLQAQRIGAEEIVQVGIAAAEGVERGLRRTLS
jgi:hypothetical protein